MAGLIKGVDVASYQSTTYSLDGIDFVFVKATEGTAYINPKMYAQAARAREAGAVTGFYHFLRKGNPQGQAAYFVNKAGARAGEILACDWESSPDGSYPTNAEKDTFIKEVKRLAPTHRVVLYCNLAYWTGRDSTSYAGDGLWIADPSAPVGSPRIQHPWLFHQYSFAGGIDRDVAQFPTRDALKNWARGLRPAESTGGTGTVALTAQQTFDAVWKTDQIGAPETAPDRATNKSWQPQSWLKDTGNRVRALETQLAAVRAQAEASSKAQAAALAAVRAQAEANGQALSAALGKLDALAGSLAQLDARNVVEALQERINGVRVTLHAEEGQT